MTSETNAILNILRRTGGRYVDTNSSPKVCEDLIVLSDGRVCPIDTRASSAQCFRLKSNTLRLSRTPIGLEQVTRDNVSTKAKQINRHSHIKISQIGRLIGNHYQLQDVPQL